jgi:hypothetical protein
MIASVWPAEVYLLETLRIILVLCSHARGGTRRSPLQTQAVLAQGADTAQTAPLTL